MVRTDRLYEELRSAGLPVVGCALVAAEHPVSGIATWHVRPEGTVRVDWAQAPSEVQISTAAAVVAAHDGASTTEERLDTLSLRQRVQAALVLRASSQWGALSQANKNRVQAVIDSAAQQVIALLS